nr:RNA-dependent RNA polymerase [Erysiphe necator associated negative-stranded RNA virus 9]
MKPMLNRTQVATSITSLVGADTGIQAVISGLSDDGYMPTNHGQYNQFRRCLHDVFCFSLIDSGHFANYELMLHSLGLVHQSKRVNMQKPDLYTAHGSSLNIGELTVTYAPESSERTKRESYSEFIDFLQESGFDVTFNVIVIDLSNPEWLESFPKISNMYVSIIQDMLDTLRLIHNNPKFQAIRKNETGFYSVDRFQFSLDDNHLSKLVKDATGVQTDASKIKLRVTGDFSSMSDEDYIASMANSIINSRTHDRPRPQPSSIRPSILQADFQEMKNVKANVSTYPRILQLGCPTICVEKPQTFEQVVHSIRTSGRSGGYLDYVQSALQRESLTDDHLITLAITTAQLEEEQRQGPGKKSYMKKHGIKYKRSEPKHIGIDVKHIAHLDEFMSKLSNEVSRNSICQLPEQDLSECGVSAYTILEEVSDIVSSSQASTILQFYQSISNEIVLNSMRRRKTRQYALGYSGFDGIYFLVAPGTQLRTESNVEFVKIISFKRSIDSQLCANWKSTGDHWESDWLSVDTDRLSHWQRSFDRVSTSLLANSERLVRPGVSMTQAVQQEVDSGNYLLLALVYLENKQLTSTTNQTIRYLWMKSLGDKSFKGLMSKFPQRVSSLLQSVMLQKSVSTCLNLCQLDLTELVTVQRIVRDSETGLYDETTTGVANLMPRLFTFGNPVPIAYNLNEIYWCMAYNKDRQNNTQDAMNILSKILKEEVKYEQEIDSRKKDHEKVNYLFGTTTLNQDIKHVHDEKPESHFYSHKAVSCGIRLQDVHPENQGDRGSWLNAMRLDEILSKNISQYATFKASVKDIQRFIGKNDLKEVEKLGKRTKAIELVAELAKDENLMTAADVAMSFSGSNSALFKVLIQIFKKGQVGGVREIIILMIKARVLFNIVEEISRLLAKADKREILTKGRDKRLMMRGDYEEIMSSFQSGTPLRIVKDSFDMTTWAQKFIPTIFLPIFEHHFSDFPGIVDLSRLIFLSHSNKEIEYPRKLVEQWCKHPEIKHDEPGMQKCKDDYLKHGKTYFVNHSNMCQGIPHYSSTVLALSCLSLRDALFKSALKQLNKDCHIKWKTRVGSDDKGSIIAMDMSFNDAYYQYLLFGQCERASERLHSMELSVKSASGHVMYELNSAFMANLETLSPTVKFSMAATDTIGTTSCTSFVNESYGRIRQMRENGCSSIVCAFAHMLNKKHFYNIFATNVGNENDLRECLKVKWSEIPYDFGVYPTYDIDLQDIVGPEFYNYRIIKKHGITNAVSLLYSEISKIEMNEMFPNDDAPLLKKDHFGINQGLVKQLTNMRNRVGANPDELKKYFDENPFTMIRGPETIDETVKCIQAKLYTKGASESLRRTSPAIYIGRLSAFRTAKAWMSPFQNQECFNVDTNEIEHSEVFTKSTYKQFLAAGIRKVEGDESKKNSINSMIHVLYPNHASLEVVMQFVGRFGPVKTGDRKFSQAVRTWTVNNFNYEYTSSLKSILETSFGISHQSSKEDVSEFKSLIGMRLESLSGVVQECKTRGIRPLDLFFYMSKLHKNSRTSKVQAFGNGPSSNSLHMTALSLKKYNHVPGTITILDAGIDETELDAENSLSRNLDLVKQLNNFIVMRDTGVLTGSFKHDLGLMVGNFTLHDRCRTIIRSIKSISGFDNVTQKTLKMVACEVLDHSELREKLSTWKSLNYTYIRKQKKVVAPSGKIQWTGELQVLVSYEKECYTLIETSGKRYVKFKQINDLQSLYVSLKMMCRTLDMELSSFFLRRPCQPGDIYLSDSSKMLHISEIPTTLNALRSIQTQFFAYKRISDMDSFRIIKDVNQKTREFQIYLRDNEGRSSTICHSNGNYYPVEISSDLTVSDDVYLMGVRLSRLLENTSWFYNYQLPSMTNEQSISFLKNDVCFEDLLSQDDLTMSRISEYIEVRDEVNEDAFSIMKNTNRNIYGTDINVDDQTMMTLNEMFRQTMDNEKLPDELKQFNNEIGDWAEEVENEVNRDMIELEGELDQGENVKMVRAFGYSKPKPYRAMNTISTLQHGAVMKSRVLNCFFTERSVDREKLRQLPHMYMYLKTVHVKLENQDRIRRSLMDLLVKKLHESTGKPKSVLKNTMDKSSGSFVIPISQFHAFLNEDTVDNVEIIDSIFDIEEDSDDESVHSESSGMNSE